MRGARPKATLEGRAQPVVQSSRPPAPGPHSPRRMGTRSQQLCSPGKRAVRQRALCGPRAASHQTGPVVGVDAAPRSSMLLCSPPWDHGRSRGRDTARAMPCSAPARPWHRSQQARTHVLGPWRRPKESLWSRAGSKHDSGRAAAAVRSPSPQPPSWSRPATVSVRRRQRSRVNCPMPVVWMHPFQG